MKIHTERARKYLDEHIGIIRGLFSGHDHVQEAKKRLLIALPFWLAGLVTAVVATIYARLFHVFENQALVIFSSFGYWALVLVPILFISSWYVVDRFAPYANGSGIPQLMAAAELSQEGPKNAFIEKLFSLRIIVAKVVSSLLGVLGGGALLD